MIFFVGIKGSGMAALAVMLDEMGEHVEGSDLEKHFFTEAMLNNRGIKIHPFGTLPPDGSTVIIGNAFKEDFEDVIKVRSNKTYTIHRYHEYLGQLSSRYRTIACTGSHGKTTSTKMMASLFSAYKPTAYLIGDGHGKLSKGDEFLVIEADEYRRFFLSYYPEYAMITNVDYDHVDYYKDEADYRLAYEQFSKNVSKALFVYGDDPEIKKLNLSGTVYTYGLNEGNDLTGSILSEDATHTRLSLNFLNKEIGIIHLPFAGRHLVWNALACIGIALCENIPLEVIEEGLSNFVSPSRRFIVDDQGDNVYIDDYAHHPTEVSVTIDAARLRYPDHKLVAVFKPHRVSRLYHFAQAFADALDKADAVFLCDFTSIDDKEEGYDIDIHYLRERSKKARVIQEDESGAKEIFEEGPACYLFMSSKDIYPLMEKVKCYQKS